MLQIAALLRQNVVPGWFSRTSKAVVFSCILMGFLLLTGCKKQDAPPPPPPERSSTSISDLVGKQSDAPPTQPVAAAPDAAQAAQPEAEGKKTSDGLPDSQRLYEGIQKYMATHQGRAAKGIEELVAGGFIPALPSLPPGKKYQLDQRFATLTVVDK